MSLSNQSLASAADQIAEALRLAIFCGDFTPGQALPQEEMARRFGVSRIPVRDAMNQLQSEGLLRVIPSKGSFVANPSPEEIRETYEIRALLESEALRLGLRHHSADTLILAERYLNGFELETDPMRLGYLDREFHAALYAPANRKRLFALINSLRTVSNQNYYREMSTSAHLRQCRIAHREIFENCRQRKLREATRALRCHLLEAGSLVAAAAARFNAQAN
jgi:DNA-binding GntR family transcriptional regulator